MRSLANSLNSLYSLATTDMGPRAEELTKRGVLVFIGACLGTVARIFWVTVA